MGDFYIEYETSSGTQTQSFTTGALLRQFIMDNKTTFINHCKVVAKLPEITNGSGLFNGCTATSIDLSEFNTSGITSMFQFFNNCRNLTSVNLSNIDVSNVTDMRYFTYNSKIITLDISHFVLNSNVNIQYMFYNSKYLVTIYCNDDWSSLVTSNGVSMFASCTSLVGAIPYDSSKTDINYANPTTGYFTIKEEPEPTGIGRLLFNSNEFKTIMFENKEYKKIIYENKVLWSKELELTPNFYIEYETSSGSEYQEFDTGTELGEFISTNKTTFINHCKVVAKLPEIISCNNLFSESEVSSLDLSEFDTSNVTNMNGMFSRCANLLTINMSGFDTSKVTNMQNMFYYSKKIQALDVSHFNTSNVTNMSQMFRQCESVEILDISNFDTSKVTSMEYMIYLCSKLIIVNVKGFNLSSNLRTRHMFAHSRKLTTIYCNDDWAVYTQVNGESMFNGCTSLVGAIAYDSAKITLEYANTTTGYFTPVN